MRKLALLLAIILTAGFGTYLLCDRLDGGEDSITIEWPRYHLKVIQDQLADLKTHLQHYKQAHGRYPTNDEGTSVLDNWEARFFVKCSHRADAPPWQINEFDSYPGHAWWLNVRTKISACRKYDGHVPKSWEEFADSPLGIYFIAQTDTANPAPLQVEVVIGKGDNLFILSQVGVLSPWRTPYIYENRNGLNPVKFRGSPANTDKQGQYSVQVDDGIFLYSPEAQLVAEEMDFVQWNHTRTKLMGGVILLVTVFLAIYLFRSKWASAKMRIAALLLTVGAGAAAGFLFRVPQLMRTCYYPAPLFSYRTPEMIAQQRELLDRYHQRGVIGDAAYAESVAALENGPATQPASGRAEEGKQK